MLRGITRPVADDVFWVWRLDTEHLGEGTVTRIA
jgi:hypothetical protein